MKPVFTRIVQAAAIVSACLFVFYVSGCWQQKPSTTPGEPKPYKVMGRWYKPLSSASGFSQRGKASWYGKQFHGHKTANGETYNMYDVTAAHKTLPLGTWVRVTNLDNGRRLDVRVNDRGPFVSGRIIDLSYAAARKLGMAGAGVANVEIEAIVPGGGAAPREEVAIDYSHGNFTIQVGAFKIRRNAERLARTLRATYNNVHIVVYDSPEHGTLNAVRVGTCNSLEQAEHYKQILAQRGFRDTFTVAE